MASITLTGTLLDPTGEVAVGDQIRFTHRTTTGETLEFARSIVIIPPNGLYNFTLEFGLIFVEYLDVKDVNYKNLGVVTVNGDTTATDLPALLNAIVPPTDAQLLLFQAILQDTEDARDIALLAAAQQTTLELIASTVIHPAGTVLTLSGYTLSGDGGGAQWKLNGVVGQPVSQSPADLGDALLNDANGNQWELIPNPFIDTAALGAVDDYNTITKAGTDNWLIFTAALVASNRTGAEIVTHTRTVGAYGYSRALEFINFSGVVFNVPSPTTKMVCTGDAPFFARWPTYGNVLFGSYATNNINPVTAYPLNVTSIDKETVTTTTAADASNFAVGDVVLVEATTTFDLGSTNLRPTWAQQNVITTVDVGTGEMGLRYPMQQLGTAEIKNMTNNNTPFLFADGVDTGIGNFATKDCKILGGHWITEKDEAPFNANGGYINCEIDVDRIQCRSGVAYGNLASYSILKCQSQETRKSGIEMAYHSHDNYVKIINDRMVSKSAGFSAAGGAIWLNEGSYNNEVEVTTLHLNDFAHDNAIKIQNGNANKITVNRVYSSSTIDGIVNITDSGFTGVRADCADNKVIIGRADGGSSVRYVLFQGNGQEFRNSVEGKFFGAVAIDAVRFATNANCESEFSGICENGEFSVTGASSDYSVSGFIPGGIARSGDFDNELQTGRFHAFESDNSRLLRTAIITRRAANATNAAPYSLTSTIAANAFNVSDTISFYLGSFISGGSSADNKTYAISFGGTTVQSYITNSTGASEVIIKGAITFESTSIVIIHYVIYQDDVAVSTRVQAVGSLDLSNPNDFDITVTPTNVGDVINVKYAQVIPNSTETGTTITL